MMKKRETMDLISEGGEKIDLNKDTWKDNIPNPPQKESPMERFIRDWNKTANPVELKGVYVRNICDVDTVNQSFKIAIGFDMIWPSTDIDVQMWNEKPCSFVPQYVPNFEFPNAKEECLERRKLENGNPFKIETVDGKPHNFLRTLVYLTCIERMELNAFPFDVQVLTVIMDMSFAPIQKAMFVPGRGTFPKPTFDDTTTTNNSSTNPSSSKRYLLNSNKQTWKTPLVILNREYCTFPDFTAKRCIIKFCSACYKGDELHDENAFRWGQVIIRFQMKRNPKGYLYRVGMYNFFLSFTSVCTFAINLTELGDRVGFLITLILASVAFQFIVSQYLPNVSYLTLLDKYTFAVFVCICMLLLVLSLIGTRDYTDEYRITLDMYCFWAYVGVLIILQCAFFVYGWRIQSRALEQFEMGELELEHVNYDHNIDKPIQVRKFLSESTKVKNVSAFLSFDGQEN